MKPVTGTAQRQYSRARPQQQPPPHMEDLAPTNNTCKYTPKLSDYGSKIIQIKKCDDT